MQVQSKRIRVFRLSQFTRPLLWWGHLRLRPQILGLIAYGIICGAAMVNNGLSIWQVVVMSLVLYSGSVQLAVLPLMVIFAPLWLVGIAVYWRFLGIL